MFQLKEDDKRNDVLKATGNILIMGGPGSGKTTIALFKAKEIAERGRLKNGQKILFLSFARATISRVEEHAGNLIPPETKSSIEINTYHGFIWNILQRHGYLLIDKPLKLLPPHEASTKMAGVKKEEISEKAHAMFEESGLVHFDIFASLCKRLLEKSNSLRKIICDIYPVIILDEFQDTNPDEWELIRLLGRSSTLIALADPEQRIYDFRGADPKRISSFIAEFAPETFDFGTENNRSNGTDIVEFGNDLLAQRNSGKEYNDVMIRTYSSHMPEYKHIALKSCVLRAIKWLNKQIPDNTWSLAVLVPSNPLMMEVSDVLQREQNFSAEKKLPKIFHDVAIDASGPSLAALFIAALLEKGSQKICGTTDVLRPLVSHILGRKSNSPPSKADVELCSALEKYISDGKVLGKNRKALIGECETVATAANSIQLTGNIISDWKMIVEIVSDCSSPYIQHLVSDVRFLRLLQKGTQLHSSLSVLWRDNQSYYGAVEAVSSALTQEHFSMSTKKWDGVNVMTIHKSKGKEFDVVIVYEGRYQGRIISKPDRLDQARLNLRVAVTRAKRCALILTPEEDPCPLL